MHGGQSEFDGSPWEDGGPGGPPPGRPDRGGGLKRFLDSDAACCLGDACCDVFGCLSPWILATSLYALLTGPRRTGTAAAPRDVPPGRTARMLYRGVRFYQREISPRRRPCCKYSPTCSAYGARALREHGALRGSWLTVRRLLRCRPGTPGGHDPVPSR